MTAHCAMNRPATLYFIEHNYGRLGRAFRELDRDTNSREAALNLIRSGEVNPVRVLEVDEECGTVRDCLQDDDFVAAMVDAILPEVRSKLLSQLAKQDHDRALQKEAV